MTAECCMKVFDQKNLSLQEAGLVSIQAVREYVSVLWGQYQVAGRRLRSQILDELERNLGIHRKSANRLMLAKRAPPLGRGKGNRKRIYCSECIKLLRRVWREMCYCNSKLLKAGLKDWLPFIDNVDESIKNKLMKMASSTMDIYLKSQRSSLRRRLNTGTKPAKSRHLTIVPIRDFTHRPTELGHCEVDLVAHCGTFLNGKFAWTLTLTDMASGWTENETISGKDGFSVRQALVQIEARLPFKIRGLYFDNGTEFLNDDVLNYFANGKGRSAPIPVRRSRPYKKNDQCFVEQKNFTHVRQVFGYARIDWKEGIDQMNKIYRNERRLISNFFTPQQKLSEKWREGSRLKRKYAPAMTPYQRLQEAEDLSGEAKDLLRDQKKIMNPVKLRKKLREKLQDFWSGRYRKQDRQITKYQA